MATFYRLRSTKQKVRAGSDEFAFFGKADLNVPTFYKTIESARRAQRQVNEGYGAKLYAPYVIVAFDVTEMGEVE